MVSGGVNLLTGYGMTFRDESVLQNAPGIMQGFSINQNMRVNVLGKVGERVSVNINHSSDNPDNEYEIAYKALDSDVGILRELRAGNVSLNIPQSSYFIKNSGTSKDSYGLKSVLQVGDFQDQTVLSLTKSKKGYKKYIGKRKLENTEVMEVSYVKRRYFLLPDQNIDPGVLLYASTTDITGKKIGGRYFKKLIVPGGKKIHDQIDEAIRAYDRLLLILSEESMNSEWVKTEIRRARREEVKAGRRKLFPISLVPFEAIRDWEAFDADIGKDMAVEVREYFVPDFTCWKDHDA